MYMVRRLSQRSTYTPATGPMRNTGMMVKERILAICMDDPGARWYTNPMSAIWLNLSPTWEMICPIHRREKLRFRRIFLNLAMLVHR